MNIDMDLDIDLEMIANSVDNHVEDDTLRNSTIHNKAGRPVLN